MRPPSPIADKIVVLNAEECLTTIYALTLLFSLRTAASQSLVLNFPIHLKYSQRYKCVPYWILYISCLYNTTHIALLLLIGTDLLVLCARVVDAIYFLSISPLYMSWEYLCVAQKDLEYNVQDLCSFYFVQTCGCMRRLVSCVRLSLRLHWITLQHTLQTNKCYVS